MMRSWKPAWICVVTLACAACQSGGKQQVKYERQKPDEKYAIVNSQRFSAERYAEIPVSSKVTVDTTDSRRSVHGWVKAVSPEGIVLADAEEFVSRQTDDQIVSEIVQAGGMQPKSTGSRYTHRQHSTLEIPADQISSVRQFKQ